MSGPNTIHIERTIERRRRYLQSIDNVEAKIEKATEAGDKLAESGARADLQRLRADLKTVDDDLKSAQALIAALNF